MTREKNNAPHPDHVERINKAIRFIDTHLDDELPLETVAAVACFSSFHFHRMFKAVTKEPLNAYITRRRIEKAASVLMRKKEVTITELSSRYGFNNNSSFTRTFKKFYGISPTEFRNKCPDKFSKISKVKSKNGQATVVFERYICNTEDHKKQISMNANIEVKEMPELQLACIAHIGHDHLKETFDRLMKWARPKGLLDAPDLKMLTIYHDSFKITAPDKVRMSACILLKEPAATEGEVISATIAKGKFVVGHFELFKTEFEKTWSDMFVWLNEHGYKTTDRNCFEIYHSDPEHHPQKKFTVDLCIPIG